MYLKAAEEKILDLLLKRLVTDLTKKFGKNKKRKKKKNTDFTKRIRINNRNFYL